MNMTFDPWDVVTMSLAGSQRVLAVIVSHEEVDTVVGHRHLVCVKFCENELASRLHELDSLDHRVGVRHPDGHFRFALERDDIDDIRRVEKGDAEWARARRSAVFSARGFAARGGYASVA